MVQYTDRLDRAFMAISDPTRRGILERLGQGDLTISDLAAGFGMTLTGLKKHVQVLERAGLVSTSKAGRVRTCTLGPRRMEDEAAWIGMYQTMLDERFDRLEAFLERTNDQDLQQELMMSSSVMPIADREIQRERIFNASRDRVWRAFTTPELLAQWWGRGNKLVIEKMELVRGGHWRYVEHTTHGVYGFEGRYREVVAQERIVRSFEWDGMPAHIAIETITFEAMEGGRTKVTSHLLLHTTEERDGMYNAGMEAGMNAAYAALDTLLEKIK